MPPRVLRRVRLGVVLVSLLSLLSLAPIAAGAVAARQAAPTPAAPPAGAATPGQGDADPRLYEAVRPDLRAEIVAATAGRLPRYRIAADLIAPADGGPGEVRGTLDLRFVNGTPGPLPELYLRLYANDRIYAEGGTSVWDVTVAGAPLEPELSVDNTVVRLPLPAPLAPGAATDVAMAFRSVVPVSADEAGYGIFSLEPEDGTWALAHWYPLLAGHDANGWSLDPLSRNGDPIFSNTALFDVRLAVPAAMVVVASGVAIEETAEGQTVRRRYVTGPVRDFTVVADDDFASVSREVDGTLVTSYYNPDDAAGGATVLDAGVGALEIYANRFGPYLYREMDLAEVRLRGAGGVEFPQLMYMGEALYRDGDRFRNPRYLEFVTAHEVGHQWWYGMVGNNQHLDAFIDEGLTEYVSTAVYFGDRYGPEEAAFQLQLECELWYLNHLFSQGDQVVDQPTDDFPGDAAYGATVYGKAAVAFGRLRAEIGDDAFFAGLRDYYARLRFGIATPADLRAAFERAAGRSLGDFWTSWFERTDGREVYDEADYAALLSGLGLR